MKRLLITGADGFVGRWLTRAAIAEGWSVTAATGPGGHAPETWLDATEVSQVTAVSADLTAPEELARVVAGPVDAVVHLAALSSGAAARRDPAGAMQVNATATGNLITAIAAAGHRPRFLLVSTGEVYGAGHAEPISEHAAIRPISPYAESKVAAEAVALERGAAAAIDVVIARAFPHTGPGQSTDFVLPAFADRLRAAKQNGAREIAVGNLDVVRDFLDVRDVARAYLLLLASDTSDRAYNVASGSGQHLQACVVRLAELLGVDVTPVVDPALVRPADIPVLIGDPSRLVAATGWTPALTFDRTLQDLVNAQAH